MCKELTVISIFLLGLLADILWIGQKSELGFNLLLQFGLAIFLLTIIVIVAKKFLLKYLISHRKFSLFSIWKCFRLKFQSNLLKRQTSAPKV